jgi:hypothetical protein
MKLLPYFIILLSFSAYAQVATDGSMGVVQNFAGQFEIRQQLGTTVVINFKK